MKHYKLTSEFIVNGFGVKLFRIELTADCKWGSEGDRGGFIEKENNLSGNAWVYGNAQVYGDARVSGNAQVYGDAWVYGDARVSGNARVYGNAWVYGDARVSGNAWVSGNAQVYGDAWVYGDARVSGNARVYGNARVSGDAWEQSPLHIQGSRHFLNESKKGFLKIGCKEFEFAYWKKHFKEIGEENGYTEAQIKEYSLYIKLAIDLSKIKKQ